MYCLIHAGFSIPTERRKGGIAKLSQRGNTEESKYLISEVNLVFGKVKLCQSIFINHAPGQFKNYSSFLNAERESSRGKIFPIIFLDGRMLRKPMESTF